MIKLKSVVLGCALLISASAFAVELNGKTGNKKRGYCDSNKPIGNSATVQRTVDGDTIYILIKGKSYSVRLLGMDTQETHFQGKSQGRWAEQATEDMGELLPEGTRVKLEFGDVACDNHGRVLAQVFRASDDLHVNAEMLRKG